MGLPAEFSICEQLVFVMERGSSCVPFQQIWVVALLVLLTV